METFSECVFYQCAEEYFSRSAQESNNCGNDCPQWQRYVKCTTFFSIREVSEKQISRFWHKTSSPTEDFVVLGEPSLEQLTKILPLSNTVKQYDLAQYLLDKSHSAEPAGAAFARQCPAIANPHILPAAVRLWSVKSANTGSPEDNRGFPGRSLPPVLWRVRQFPFAPVWVDLPCSLVFSAVSPAAPHRENHIQGAVVAVDIPGRKALFSPQEDDKFLNFRRGYLLKVAALKIGRDLLGGRKTSGDFPRHTSEHLLAAIVPPYTGFALVGNDFAVFRIKDNRYHW